MSPQMLTPYASSDCRGNPTQAFARDYQWEEIKGEAASPETARVFMASKDHVRYSRLVFKYIHVSDPSVLHKYYLDYS